MSDKIQSAYESSKNIYDDVLTQGNFISRMYNKLIVVGMYKSEVAEVKKMKQRIFYHG